MQSSVLALCRVLGSVPELAEDEDSDDDLGPDGWDDVLSAWMGSAGLPDVWSGSGAQPQTPSGASSRVPSRVPSPTPRTVDRETSTPVRGRVGKPPVGPSPRRSLEMKLPAAAAVAPAQGEQPVL